MSRGSGFEPRSSDLPVQAGAMVQHLVYQGHLMGHCQLWTKLWHSPHPRPWHFNKDLRDLTKKCLVMGGYPGTKVGQQGKYLASGIRVAGKVGAPCVPAAPPLHNFTTPAKTLELQAPHQRVGIPTVCSTFTPPSEPPSHGLAHCGPQGVPATPSTSRGPGSGCISQDQACVGFDRAVLVPHWYVNPVTLCAIRPNGDPRGLGHGVRGHR